MHPALTDADQLRLLGHQLCAEGVQTWALQRARDIGTRAESPTATAAPATNGLVDMIATEFAGAFASVTTR